MSEKFSNKQVGDPFVLDLITLLQEYGGFDDIKRPGIKLFRNQFDVKRDIAKRFKEQFLDFYSIGINDVFECVSDYVTKINNDPNDLSSLEEKARMALEVIACVKNPKMDSPIFDMR